MDDRENNTESPSASFSKNDSKNSLSNITNLAADSSFFVESKISDGFKANVKNT